MVEVTCCHVRLSGNGPAESCAFVVATAQLRLSPEQGPFRSVWVGARISARLILAGSVAVICLASYLGYVRLTSRLTSGPAQTSIVQTTPLIQDGSIPGSPGGKAIDPPDTGAPTRMNNGSNRQDKAAAKAKGPGLDQTTSQSARRAMSDRSTATKAPSSPGAGPAAQPRDEDVAADDAQRQCSRRSETQGSKKGLHRNAR